MPEKKKVECPKCHRMIDVRGIKAHLGTHGVIEGNVSPRRSHRIAEPSDEWKAGFAAGMSYGRKLA